MIREIIQESQGKISDVNKLEKALPKVFKLEDYFNLFQSVHAPYDYSAGIYGIIEKFAKQAGVLEKLEVSKGAYVKDQVWRSENGYGNYGTPRREYMEEWDEMSVEERINYNWRIDEVKFIKKASSLITKSIGKQKVSLEILLSLFGNANSAYDRNLSIKKALENGLNQLWYDSGDVYNIIQRASLRNINKTELYDWLRGKK